VNSTYYVASRVHIDRTLSSLVMLMRRLMQYLWIFGYHPLFIKIAVNLEAILLKITVAW
jgi:hypothetical protein